MTQDRPHFRLPGLVQRNVDAFLAGLHDRFGPRLKSVRLFGSYARGTATVDSDVDLLVLLDRVDPEDDRAVTDLAGDLTWQIGGSVLSPLVMSESAFDEWKRRERLTPREIEREGIVL